jgi:hypothetical protein
VHARGHHHYHHSSQDRHGHSHSVDGHGRTYPTQQCMSLVCFIYHPFASLFFTSVCYVICSFFQMQAFP